MVSGAFQGLQSLNKINLIGNDIVCVDREALESLANVEEIEIDLRYLQCSCANDWVRDWVVQRRANVINYNCPSSTGSSSAAVVEGCHVDQISCNLNTACPAGCSCKVRIYNSILISRDWHFFCSGKCFAVQSAWSDSPTLPPPDPCHSLELGPQLTYTWDEFYSWASTRAVEALVSICIATN